jgi:hypothetical protein
MAFYFTFVKYNFRPSALMQDEVSCWHDNWRQQSPTDARPRAAQEGGGLPRPASIGSFELWG